jgi:hypothetical protein
MAACLFLDRVVGQRLEVAAVLGQRGHGLLDPRADIDDVRGLRPDRGDGNGAALALGAVVLWQGAAEDGLTRVSSPPAWFPAEAPRAEGAYPLLSRYGPVTDVLPYAADGTPLTGVLLFDQDGRPLHVGRQEWWADGCVRVLQQPLAADGVPVAFSYPQAYVLDPAGLDRFGTPVSAGQCSAGLPRPAVPLPVFPAPPPGG